MKTTIAFINERGFSLLGNLDDEEDVLNQFDEYDDGYVGDVISEIADSNVPIYYDDIWENVRDIKEYVEEAQAQGLCEGVRELDKIFQIGYYQYYSQSLYDNLDTLAFNRVTKGVNEYLNGLDDEDVNKVDIGEIEEKIESETSNFDNNNYISVLTYTINDIIEDIDNMLSEEEDE